jgi:tetratricopeptide (TPR) repeat protein
MAYASKKVSDLPKRLQQIVNHAKSAISQHNNLYACEMLRNILREEPGCNEARKMLRLAQLEHFGANVTPIGKQLAAMKTAWPVFVKGPMLLQRGKLVEALDVAEKAMTADPTAVPTCLFLYNCAMKAGLNDMATDVLEISVKYNSNDLVTLEKIVNHYRQIDQSHKAIPHLQRLCQLQPQNMALENEMKQLSAEATMQRHKMDEVGSFRDMLKDKKAAETLEQAERVAVRDEKALGMLIADAEAKVAEKPVAATFKRLATLLEQAKEFDRAMEMYEKTMEAMGALDPSLDEAITRVMMAQCDDAIAQWQAYGEQDPEQKAEADQKVAEIQAQKAGTLFQRYKERVDRYPNDTMYRFQLGELHYQRGEYDEALKQLQIAQRNPQLRKRAGAGMGKCMIEKGLLDMAIETFTAALGDTQHIDGESKDILYNLALVYESSGKDKDALECLKQIFAVDVNYRDVGTRIESFYQKGTH